MSLFLPPISPVKDSATGRTVQPPTLTPYKEITLQEVYKLITSSERLKTLTETVRRAAENGDEKIYRMLKQQTLPYVTPCGVFSYRKSDSLTGPSGLIVVDIDHLDSRGEAEKLKSWSTMLYSAPTSSDRMHGSENLRISAPTGCSARKELDWDSFMLASDFPPKGKKTAHAARVPANLGSRHTPRSHTVSYPNAVHPCIVPSSQI